MPDPRSLTNKYFIVAQPTGGKRGKRSAQQLVCHGRILGPVSELIPAYLVEMFPVSHTTATIATQTILPLQAFIDAQLFDDEREYAAHWALIEARMAECEAEAAAAKAAKPKSREEKLKAHLTMMIDMLKADGIQTIYIGNFDELRKRLPDMNVQTERAVPIEVVEQVEDALDALSDDE